MKTTKRLDEIAEYISHEMGIGFPDNLGAEELMAIARALLADNDSLKDILEEDKTIPKRIWSIAGMLVVKSRLTLIRHIARLEAENEHLKKQIKVWVVTGDKMDPLVYGNPLDAEAPHDDTGICITEAFVYGRIFPGE